MWACLFVCLACFAEIKSFSALLWEPQFLQPTNLEGPYVRQNNWCTVENIFETKVLAQWKNWLSRICRWEVKGSPKSPNFDISKVHFSATIFRQLLQNSEPHLLASSQGWTWIHSFSALALAVSSQFQLFWGRKGQGGICNTKNIFSPIFFICLVVHSFNPCLPAIEHRLTM